jgi:hypothetical protein
MVILILNRWHRQHIGVDTVGKYEDCRFDVLAGTTDEAGASLLEKMLSRILPKIDPEVSF